MGALEAQSALAEIAAARFVPVIRADSGEAALRAGRALARGGCRVLEVTLTTPDAPAVIAALVADGVVMGAGTVLDLASAEIVWAAGASFVVSPNTQPDLLRRGLADKRLVIPGALTPNEVLAAHAAGAALIKLFPVASMGGPRYLQLLRDPLPFLSFFPTGGVTLEDAPAYLAAGALAVGVGTAVALPSAVASGDVAELEARAQRWCQALAVEPVKI